nr:glucosidase 1B-like protein [Parasacculina yatsui]
MGKARYRGYSNTKESPPRESLSRQKARRRGFCPGLSSWLIWLMSAVLLSIGGYLGYQGYLERRVSTPLPYPKVIQPSAPDDLYWGTYRPGHYFGLKVRHPRSPVFGLMWFTPSTYTGGNFPLRHWCDQGDGLRFGWRQHDGRSFGEQEVVDGKVQLITSFVKRPGAELGGDWSARVAVTPRWQTGNGTRVSLLFYAALDDDALSGSGGDSLHAETDGDTLRSIEGSTEALGKFRLSFEVVEGTPLRRFYLSTRTPSLRDISDSTLGALRVVKAGREAHIGLSGIVTDEARRPPNLVVYQVVGVAPFQLEIRYQQVSGASPVSPLSEAQYDRLLAERRSQFAERFRRTFPPVPGVFDRPEHVQFAHAALSNMLGGIGYFYGSSLVQSPLNREPVPYWRAPLFTAVPSRSFFPRGFLWDEGFHQLLVGRWDEQLSREIVGHWLDLINVDGWIPREQILGGEAAARVPAEFIVQRSSHANPPTLVLALHTLLEQMSRPPSLEQLRFLELAWPRLEVWYDWFNRTQTGPLPGTYRWRGRDSDTVLELNPKTLSSGLDDYPRASHPSGDERHLDLRCWMAVASQLMAEIGTHLGSPSVSLYAETYRRLSDSRLLDALHWSDSAAGYMDYGLHTDEVRLSRAPPGKKPEDAPGGLRREVLSPPLLQHVGAHGYVSVFPLLLQLLQPDSERLPAVLDSLESPRHLWTEFGLRSLAASAPLYDRRNTEHDPPYWRGPIWLNANYLAVRALAHYGATPGPQQQRARAIHDRLRDNLVANLLTEYKRTGFIWEQYNDRTGRGQGCRPFTGWSSLIVLIMTDHH